MLYHSNIKKVLLELASKFRSFQFQFCQTYRFTCITWTTVNISETDIPIPDDFTFDNLGTVPLGWSAWGPVIRDHSDHGASHSSHTLTYTHSGHGFIGSIDTTWSEWSWITDPDADNPKMQITLKVHAMNGSQSYLNIQMKADRKQNGVKLTVSKPNRANRRNNLRNSNWEEKRGNLNLCRTVRYVEVHDVGWSRCRSIH